MFQKDVFKIKVAIYPTFPDSYSILCIPELGTKREFGNLIGKEVDHIAG